MSNFSASIPTANMQAANTLLEEAGNNIWEPGVFGWETV